MSIANHPNKSLIDLGYKFLKEANVASFKEFFIEAVNVEKIPSELLVKIEKMLKDNLELLASVGEFLLLKSSFEKDFKPDEKTAQVLDLLKTSEEDFGKYKKDISEQSNLLTPSLSSYNTGLCNGKIDVFNQACSFIDNRIQDMKRFPHQKSANFEFKSISLKQFVDSIIEFLLAEKDSVTFFKTDLGIIAFIKYAVYTFPDEINLEKIKTLWSYIKYDYSGFDEPFYRILDIEDSMLYLETVGECSEFNKPSITDKDLDEPNNIKGYFRGVKQKYLFKMLTDIGLTDKSNDEISQAVNLDKETLALALANGAKIDLESIDLFMSDNNFNNGQMPREDETSYEFFADRGKLYTYKYYEWLRTFEGESFAFPIDFYRHPILIESYLNLAEPLSYPYDSVNHVIALLEGENLSDPDTLSLISPLHFYLAEGVVEESIKYRNDIFLRASDIALDAEEVEFAFSILCLGLLGLFPVKNLLQTHGYEIKNQAYAKLWGIKALEKYLTHMKKVADENPSKYRKITNSIIIFKDLVDMYFHDTHTISEINEIKVLVSDILPEEDKKTAEIISITPPSVISLPSEILDKLDSHAHALLNHANQRFQDFLAFKNIKNIADQLDKKSSHEKTVFMQSYYHIPCLLCEHLTTAVLGKKLHCSKKDSFGTITRKAMMSGHNETDGVFSQLKNDSEQDIYFFKIQLADLRNWAAHTQSRSIDQDIKWNSEEFYMIFVKKIVPAYIKFCYNFNK